jgi:(p)ppGpp synthase/HD superfamily hydrolase
MSLVEKARLFATAAHGAIGQVRKYTGDPYIVHPAKVVELIHCGCDIVDEVTLSAAWLHDVVEDTKITNDEIRKHFGDDVANLVSDLTDVSRPEDGNREARKKLDREHLAKADPRAKTVKLADMADNTKCIIKHDKDFAKVYLREKRLLLPLLKEGNSMMFDYVEVLLEVAESQLDANTI